MLWTGGRGALHLYIHAPCTDPASGEEIDDCGALAAKIKIGVLSLNPDAFCSPDEEKGEDDVRFTVGTEKPIELTRFAFLEEEKDKPERDASVTSQVGQVLGKLGKENPWSSVSVQLLHKAAKHIFRDCSTNLCSEICFCRLFDVLAKSVQVQCSTVAIGSGTVFNILPRQTLLSAFLL
jgi:hypothetical protein